MSRDIQIEWVKHLKRGTKEYEEFKSLVRNSTTILDRLSDILKEQMDALETSELSEKQYDQSNWAMLQAHRNGKKQQIVATLALLKTT